ncbi:hypothetical protein [Vibrio splendidus]|uniref:hypothetical protein n=1 Tax=Vibrio splendidus TaxID=29497 RepID=UPI0018E43F46|nr:hypothetical protein [Vibrio splendidus]
MKANRTDETRAKERARKQKSRKNAAARRESLGLERVEIELSKKVRDELETLRHARALSGEPYSVAELSAN